MYRNNLWSSFARNLLVGLAIVALSGGRLFAQQSTGRIEGKVVADGTSEPIAGVTVLVEGTGRTAITDGRGVYRINGVKTGDVVVVTRYLGREPARGTVSVTPGSTAQADFSLKEAAFRLSDIVVSASREEQKRVEIPVAIGVIDGGTLRATQPNHPAEALNKVAGVMVRVTNGEGHMTAIRQPITTDPVYLYLEDGIPTRSTGFFNHNALYEVNLPQADRIEVSKGPATALYGSDAIGGVINVSTRAPSGRPQATLSLDGGRYNWGRILATGSNTFGRTGLRADLNLTRTDGWRDSTGYTRQSGTVRWDQALGSSSHLKSVATFSRINQQSEGSSISASDFSSNPLMNYSPFAARQVRAVRYSMAFEKEGASHSFSVTPYARYDWMRLVPNWTITYDPTDYTTQNKSLGMLVKYRKDFAPMRTRVILGADADLSPGSQVEQQAVDTKIPGSNIYRMQLNGTTLYDYDVTYHGVSQYVQIETSPFGGLRLDGGLRFDESGYEYTNHLTPLATGRWRRPADTKVSYQHVSPKLGATYQFADEFNLFASYRHGFRAPSQGQLFRQGSALNTIGLQPVKVNSYEAGIRGRIAKRVDYDFSAYDMVKTDDILSYTFPDAHSEAQNAGKTTHRGIEASLGLQIVPAVRIDAAWSYAEHMYAEWLVGGTTTTVDLSGKEIVSAPRSMGGVSLSVAPAKWNGARFGAEVERLGSYWEDQANTHKYTGYTLLNLRAATPQFRGVSFSARMMNVTNKLYSTLTSYTVANGEQFAPGQGRRLYVTAEYNIR